MELDWGKYIAVAERFQHKARYQDREDLNHDILLELATAQLKHGDSQLTEPALYRIASFVVADYWRKSSRIVVASLNDNIDDDEGNSTELIDTLTDDKAIDFEAWLDAKRWLLGCPKRLAEVATKQVSGKPLDGAERKYLCKWRREANRKAQAVLVEG